MCSYHVYIIERRGFHPPGGSLMISKVKTTDLGHAGTIQNSETRLFIPK